MDRESIPSSKIYYFAPISTELKLNSNFKGKSKTGFFLLCRGGKDEGRRDAPVLGLGVLDESHSPSGCSG